MQLTDSFRVFLLEFAPHFTQPSMMLFLKLATGWIFTGRHRYITEMIFTSGNVGKGHWSRFHRFFSRNKWVLDDVCRTLAKLIVRVFAPVGELRAAVDDTLCRKRGLKVFGAGMHHDPLASSKAVKVFSWGHSWVVVSIVVSGLPWAPTKVFALPVLFRLYVNRQGDVKGAKQKANGRPAPKPPGHKTRPELAVELLTLLAGWFPDREIIMTGDSLYGGQSVAKHLPVNVQLLSRVNARAALYAPAPPRQPGAKGRPRKRGERLSGMEDWADDPRTEWTTLAFDQFGLHGRFAVATRHALYYRALGSRLVVVVLVRDLQGGRPLQMFFCTRLDWDARTILTAYSHRWAIEVAFEGSKQLLGMEDLANRTPKAVQRTAPIGWLLYSLVIVWFHQTGHAHVQFPDRPWYRRKQEPSFGDMLNTLRRISAENVFCNLQVDDARDENHFAFVIDFMTRAG